MAKTTNLDYSYTGAEPGHTASYLWAPLVELLRKVGARRVLDVGCGNGAFSAHLARCGFEVVGCDPSPSGTAIAAAAHPDIRFHQLGVYDEPIDLGTLRFDAVVALEVVEHLHMPRRLPQFAARVLAESGHLLISTPYHGYIKNLAISVVGGWDRHWSPCWDGGHVKLWSRSTLSRLLLEEGFAVERFRGVGRLPRLWKSMIVSARRQ